MTLTEARAAIGQPVIYRPRDPCMAPVEGVITSVADRLVLVRYRGARTSLYTPPNLLEPLR